MQTFALQTVIERLGNECQVVKYDGYGNKGFEPEKKEKYIKKNANPLYWFAYCLFARTAYREKYKRFSEFQNMFLHLVEYTKEINKSFDCVVCGSDQIWNPHITNGLDSVYFGKESKYAIAYAASAGDLENVKREASFIPLLSGFKYISVREQNLNEYINQSCHINCSLVVDPTFLLEKKDYLGLVQEKFIPSKPYLCVYQLSRNKYTSKIVYTIAKEKGLEVIELCGCDCVFPNRYECTAGPIEFLSLIHGAEYVITNSYHGTVFSILFEKNFNTVYSKSGNSRIDTVLDYFNLKSRIILNMDSCIETGNIDYNNVSKARKILKQESMKYLQLALGDINN